MSIDTTFRVKNGVEVPDAEKLFTTDTPLTSKPSLNFIFNKTEYLDPRITFTRSGPATRTNSRGLIESVAVDKARFDYNPVTRESKGLLIEEARTNLFRYTSGFEDAWLKSSVIITSGAIVAPDGTLSSSKIVETANYNQHLMYQSKEITSSVTYVYSIYAKAAEWTSFRLQLGSSGPIGVFDLSTGIATTESGATSASMVPAGNGWYRCSLVGVSNGSSTHYVYKTSALYTGDGVSGLHIWGAQLEEASFATSYIPSTNTFTSRASVGTYYDSTGTLQTAAINTARYQHNPDNLSAQPFLLLEPARTNFVRNDFAVNRGGSVSTGTAIAPDGTTARKFVPTAGVVSYPSLGTANNATTFTAALGATVDVAYTGYFAATGPLNYKPYVVIDVSTGNSTNRIYSLSRLNLATGTIEFSGVNAPVSILTAATLVRQRSGMYKFSIVVRYTQDATTRDTITSYVQCHDHLNTATGYTADGVSGFQAALLQCELSSYPTSYIPTTTAAVTRSADVSSSATATRAADQVNIQNISSWFNPTEGTMFAEAIGTTVVANTYPTLFGLRPTGDTGSNTTIELFLTQVAYNGLIRLNGVNQAIYAPSATITASNKVALAYKTNDFAMTLNSGTVYTDTSVILPTNLAQARIGYLSGNQYLNGWVERIVYYPRRLSNTELQAITL